MPDPIYVFIPADGDRLEKPAYVGKLLERVFSALSESQSPNFVIQKWEDGEMTEEIIR